MIENALRLALVVALHYLRRQTLGHRAYALEAIAVIDLLGHPLRSDIGHIHEVNIFFVLKGLLLLEVGVVVHVGVNHFLAHVAKLALIVRIDHT